MVDQVTNEEFSWQDAHYSRDSRYGRETLFLIADSAWIRATSESVAITRSDAIDTTIKIEIDIDRITHEAFHSGVEKIWLPLLVLPLAATASPATSRRAHRRRFPAGQRRAGRWRDRDHQPTRAPAAPPRRRRARMSEPDPFTGLIVTDAKGDLLPMVPIVDTRHWVSAAMAEIIVNMAAARWASPDRKRPTANRPVATRDQRLVLSAAIYRLLRNRSGQGLAAGTAVTSPALGRVATAKSELSTLLRAYVDDYWDYIKHRSIAPDNGPPGNGNRLGSFGYTLTQRAVQVLEALMQAVVVVVPVNRAQTPTVLTVQLPARHLEADPMRGPAPPRAELGIDLLMPSADADRQIQVSLPDGVSLDLSGPRPPASMVIEVDPPPPLKDLADLMACLVEPGQEDLPAGDRQCLSDLAVAKAEAATETLRQDLLCLPAGAHSSLSITTATQDACIRLTGLQEELSNPPGADRQSTQQSLETLRALWGSGDWLRGPLRRRATADPLGPGTIVGRAGVIEDLTRRPTPRRARLYVRVEVTDAEFFSIARFAGVMSVILMTVVLAFLVIGAGRHRADAPSAEVLAGALTLFSAIQAGRIDHPDRSTLRGLLSAAGNWLVVASILPTIVLAVALAFNASGWTPVAEAAAAIGLQILLQLTMGPWLRFGRRTRPRRHQRLRTSPPDYAGLGVLRSQWWQNATADALTLGRQATGYVVWEHEGAPSLTGLLVARQANPASSVASPGARWRLPTRFGQLILVPHAGSAAGDTGVSGLIPRPRRQPTEAPAIPDDGLGEDTPANILALLRSGTAAQALTFIVFREEPAKDWAAKLDRCPIAFDPDRLAPTETASDIVEIFLDVPPSDDWPALDQHPISAVLEAAADRRLLVLEADLPIPCPVAGVSGRTWARVRIGLRDAEIRRLPAFLDAIRQKLTRTWGESGSPEITSNRLPCDVWARTVPGGALRATARDPASTVAEEQAVQAGRPSRLVRAPDMDVVTKVAREETAGDPEWRVIALCADARAGIEWDLLGTMGRTWPGMRLAGLTYAVLHGTAVILMLAHEPDGRTGKRGELESLAEQFPDAHVRIAFDRWQSARQLGYIPDGPLLGVHLNGPDQPGTLIDTLDSLYETIQEMLPNRPEVKHFVWHAVTRVATRSATRMTIRIAGASEEVGSWNRAKFEEIERLTRQRAIRAAAARQAASLTDDKLGTPEATVISVGLVRMPGGERASPESADEVTAGNA